MTPGVMPLAVLAIVLPWSLYRRVRRNVGRQALSPLRLTLRCGVMLAVLALVAWTPLQTGDLEALAGLLLGGAGGAAIGVWALRHTQFGRDEQGEYYTPHPYIGLTVSALLIGRMLYRVWQMVPTLAAGGQPALGAVSSPLTLAVVGLVLAYYGGFYAGVLRQHARQPARG